MLRWIGVLPGAALLSFLAAIAYRSITGLLYFRSLEALDGSHWATVSIDLTSAALLGAAFIYVASRIAPAYRATVATAAFALALVTSGVLLLPAVENGPRGLAQLAAAVIGATITCAWARAHFRHPDRALETIVSRSESDSGTDNVETRRYARLSQEQLRTLMVDVRSDLHPASQYPPLNEPTAPSSALSPDSAKRLRVSP